ncbi:MAG: recombinase family protein [Thermoleophilia bacterium]
MRAYGYIRVSKARDEMISPEIQRDEITRFAGEKGWTITGWYEDLDMSGRAWDRKRREGLNRLLDDALAGGCDVVLFHKIDRLAREEEDFHAILAALRRAGIHCDSPGNPNDGSAESALIWSISAALAKYESVKIGSRIRDALRRLRSTGRWHGGPVPFGFRLERDEDGSRLVAEPEEQKVRLWIHDRYHRSWGAKRIAMELNKQGIPTQRGRIWERATVEAIVFRPSQVGAREVEGELLFGGNIEAIVPLETYEKTMAIHEARRRRPSRQGRTPRVPLTGRHIPCPWTKAPHRFPPVRERGGGARHEGRMVDEPGGAPGVWAVQASAGSVLVRGAAIGVAEVWAVDGRAIHGLGLMIVAGTPECNLLRGAEKTGTVLQVGAR